MAITLEQKNQLLAKYPGLQLNPGVHGGFPVPNTYIIVYLGTKNPINDNYEEIDACCKWIQDNN